MVNSKCAIYNKHGRTLSLVVEAIGFDNLLLNLCGYWKDKLQHLPHVIAGTLPGLLHPCNVFRYREGLDDLTKHHCMQTNQGKNCITKNADITYNLKTD